MWSGKSLFVKSQLYIRKALEHEVPDSSEVPLFAFIALEFLARSVLATINVGLLADPRDGYNVLHACGYGGKKAPVSIPTKTVFHRCTVVCSEFTEKDYALCMEWMNHRNEELHSGEMPLEGLSKAAWMPDLFRVALLLLGKLDRCLADFVGSANEMAAREMVNALSEDLRKEAFAIIGKSREEFEKLEAEERLVKIAESKKARFTDWGRKSRGLEIKCLACEGAAIVTGELIRSTTPHDEEGQLVQEDVRLPTALHCYACGLELQGYAHLHAVELGDHFTIKDYLDVADYYGIEFDPEEFYGAYDEGYMNE